MAGANDILSSASTLSASDLAAPLLAAAFLIKFDLKVGYTIAWKQSISSVELDGAVEFKSLPSGLHMVNDDLVYFIHDNFAGLSAFVNKPASESERNARFVSVGILVPLSYGRLGRSWLHAQSLRDLASTLVDDTNNTEPLEQFWERYRQNKSEDKLNGATNNGGSARRPSASIPVNSKSERRARTLSTLVNVLPSDQLLPSFHPALSILRYLDTLGPLIFPLHRAALLRKRILFMTTPPVRSCCEYVFDLSILSSIPASVVELLTEDTERLHRLRPYFTIGIHDIPQLEKELAPENAIDTDKPFGWAACTTDEILSMKTKVYDIIIEMPPEQRNDVQQKLWPKMKTNAGTEIKATQRDLRRWKILQQELHHVRNNSYREYHDDQDDDDETDGDDTALLQHYKSISSINSTGSVEEPEYDDKMIESMSWSQLAYNGFMWWASAGEQDTSGGEDAERDRQVMGDLSEFVPLSPRAHRGSNETQEAPSEPAAADAGIQTAIIAYFHRLTSGIISTLAEIIESADDEERADGSDSDHEEGDIKGVFVGSDEIMQMGLDAWSETDGAFAREMLRMYFGRDATVRGAGIDCCGLRIC